MIDRSLKNAIDSHKVISFDMFDTLVLRNVPRPEDVFLLIQNHFKGKHRYENFACIRVDAYKKAYEQYKASCTLDNIYECMPIFTKEERDILKQLEISTEIEVCMPNYDFVNDVYNYAICKGKTVIITTDMYLPHGTIVQILNSCGITGYKELFLSCEQGVSKTDGGLYKKCFEILDISNKDLLHVGDGWKNDIIRAKMMGISCYHVNSLKNPDYDNKTHLSKEEKAIYEHIQKIVTNTLPLCKDEEERIGVEVFGPLLFGFVNWLHHEFNRNKFDKVYFLAREGLLFKKIYEILFPNEKLQIHYLYVSRKSLIGPTYWIMSEYSDLMNSIAKSKQISISNQIRRWGLDPKECIPDIEQVGFTTNSIIDGRSWETNEKLKNLYSLLKNRIVEASKTSYYFLAQYLRQENFGGRCAIVDIGWNGGMQNAFKKIASVWEEKTEVFGYYIGINTKNLGTKLENISGYVYDESHHQDNRYLIYSFAGPFELSLTAPHETTIGYRIDSKDAVPVFGSNEYILPDGTFLDELKYTIKVQAGIVKFIKYAKKANLESEIPSEVAFRNCREFGIHPKFKHIKLFESFGAYDMGEKQHFVNPQYLHLIGENNIAKGFWTSTWKCGFMKKILKISLPYHKIYTYMRKKIDG